MKKDREKNLPAEEEFDLSDEEMSQVNGGIGLVGAQEDIFGTENGKNA